MEIIARSINGLEVGQRQEDGYVNATALSKAHFEATGNKRDITDWLTNARTQETLEHLSLKTDIPVIKLTESKAGRYGGTWIHPKLATRFAIWLSDEFGYQVESSVEEWMTTGNNPVVTPPSRLTKIQIIAEMALQMAEQEQQLLRHQEQIALLDTTVNEHQQQLQQIEQRRVESLENLYAMPPAEVEAAPLTTRAKINQVVRNYCNATGVAHNEAWSKVYKEFYYRYHIDLKARSGNSKRLRPLDVCEGLGKMDELYAIALDILKF